MKKLSRKSIVKKLDTLVSEKIRQIEPMCFVCGSQEKLGAGHVFSRRAYGTRWELDEYGNVHVQCWPCNYRHTIDQWPYYKACINKWGIERFEALRVRYQTIRKFKTYELEELVKELS